MSLNLILLLVLIFCVSIIPIDARTRRKEMEMNMDGTMKMEMGIDKISEGNSRSVQIQSHYDMPMNLYWIGQEGASSEPVLIVEIVDFVKKQRISPNFD